MIVEGKRCIVGPTAMGDSPPDELSTRKGHVR